MDILTTITEFKQHLRAARYAPATIDSYRKNLDQFSRRERHMMRCLMTIFVPAYKCMILSPYIAFIVIIVTAGNGNAETNKSISTLMRLEMLEQSLSNYKIDVGRYPTSEEGLNALLKNSSNIESWRGPYINMPLIPNDHWGSKFIYIFPAKYGNKEYDLFSIGRNMEDDYGNGDDISNWNKINLDFYKNHSVRYSPKIVLISFIAICIAIFLYFRKRNAARLIGTSGRDSGRISKEIYAPAVAGLAWPLRSDDIIRLIGWCHLNVPLK